MPVLLRLVITTCLLTAATARADWKNDVGYTRLQLLAGSELPTAPTNGYTQAEAPDGTNYAPDTTSSLFSGHTFTLKSGASGANGHASAVATNFYGNTTSLLPGSAAIDLYNANTWIFGGYLRTSTASIPATESRAIQNHSWIAASGNEESVVIDAGQRLDFAINRDGFVSVVGVNNGESTVLPQLLCQTYNTISVGLVNGGHSAGFTTIDGIGRIKPDIVAPDGLTSFATPMVSGAAGLLYAKLQAAPYSLTGADRPRAVKALLLAGATKDTVASWSNTSTRPLDIRYGAGALNVYNSYSTLRSGKVVASNSSSVPARAWAVESVSANSTKTYFFTVPAGTPDTPFSAALTWHRIVTDNVNGPSFGDLTSSLANLNLRLYSATNFTLGTLVTESASTLDNVELVYQSALEPGTYALVVENLSATATPYALAWHTRAAVSASATTPIASELGGQTGFITLTRTGDTTLPLLAPLSIGGTAVPGTHYQALPATVTFAAGQLTTTLAVTPISDAIAQGDRTVTVLIADDFSLVRDPLQIATVTIQDKPYDTWRFARFTSTELADATISGDSADPDTDSLPNLMEYALNAEPKTTDAPVHAPIVGTADDHLTLTYTPPTTATDVTYTVEWSADLQTWSTGATATETVSTTDTGNGTTTVIVRSVTTLTATPRQFLRLRVTKL